MRECLAKLSARENEKTAAFDIWGPSKFAASDVIATGWLRDAETRSSVSVSYTHLDVDRRQVQELVRDGLTSSAHVSGNNCAARAARPVMSLSQILAMF